MPTETPIRIDYAHIGRKLLHPLAARILDHMAEHDAPISPVQLARELHVPLNNLSYHVRRLLDAKLIRLTRTEPRRGTLEHFYTLTKEAKA